MLDINIEIENSKLEKALDDFINNGSPENQAEMINQVIEGRLYNPVIFHPMPKEINSQGKAILEEGTEIHFNMIESEDNKLFYTGFTSKDQLNKWEGIPDNINTAAMDFKEYADLIENADNVSGFILNPFSHNIIFDSNMIQILLELIEANK